MKYNLILSIATSAILVSCNNISNDKAPVPTKEPSKAEAVAQRFYSEVCDKHNIAMIDTLVDAAFMDHSPDMGYTADIAGLKKDFAELYIAYPDLSIKSDFMITEGDLVSAHVIMTGTNSGPMGDMPATNKKVKVEGVDILRVKDGKITEHWGYMDQAKMMEQLGQMPEMNASADKDKGKDKK